MRFAAAVQAALEDGFRVFTELSPHPLLTHAVDQTARSLDMSAAALAAMRREQPLPHGLRGLLGDLYAAGAAVDFSVLYPGGHLVDAPLPAWTHRPLLLSRDGHGSLAHGTTVAVHPLLGAHVRLPEEPERHVWQGSRHRGAALAGRSPDPRCGRASRGRLLRDGADRGPHRLGEAAEVRDVRFEQMLLLDEETQIGVTATVEAPGVVPFAVETNQERRTLAGGPRRSCTPSRMTTSSRPRPGHRGPAGGAPEPPEGDDLRQEFDLRGIQYGPAFAGLAAAHTAEGAGDTVLAEVGVPSSIRAQQGAYGVHPALLDACFQSVAAHPSVRERRRWRPAAAAGCPPAARLRLGPHARYCLTTVTAAAGGAVEADLDILDEHGTVLLAVRGLQMGTGASPSSERDRVLGERLLTIEWQQRELPEKTVTEPGTWLLISTSDAADMVATELTDALKMHDAQSTTMSWPLQADHAARPSGCAISSRPAAFNGVVVLTAPKNGNPDEESCRPWR